MWKYFSYANYVNYVFRHFEMRREKQLHSKKCWLTSTCKFLPQHYNQNTLQPLQPCCRSFPPSIVIYLIVFWLISHIIAIITAKLTQHQACGRGNVWMSTVSHLLTRAWASFNLRSRGSSWEHIPQPSADAIWEQGHPAFPVWKYSTLNYSINHSWCWWKAQFICGAWAESAIIISVDNEGP